MKKSLFISIISLLFLSMNISASDNPVPEPKPETLVQTAVLHGMVFDKLTNETLAGAAITANGKKVYTDLDGNFTLSNLCGDKCQLQISFISYEEQTIEIDTNSVQSLQIKLQQR